MQLKSWQKMQAFFILLSKSLLASDGDLALAAKDVVVVVASVAACDGAGNVGCWCC